MHWLQGLIFACLAVLALVRAAPFADNPKQFVVSDVEKPLQDIVRWDEKSLILRGKKIMFFSGEFHPFRLPVPSLWLDVFQKIRSMGYTGVSFYVHWAMLEGKPGNYSANGVFDLEPFFQAAEMAGIYLLARPGPYINAEVTGGGFPGWTQRIQGRLRTSDQDYLKATDLYTSRIGATIAKYQITKGGPVILFQPENEYSGPAAPDVNFPDAAYMSYVFQQYRKAGIVVPYINNDAWNGGINAPGTPAAVDIYGHDGYPLGFDCANPTTWPRGKLPTDWRKTHLRQSPKTPYSIIEFQGGSFDPWGGYGFEACTNLVNSAFERVFYKNLYGFGTTIFNIYMTYGGTNWGNLGHPGGYTSYDYGSVISENRAIDREKYSEAKLQANFIVSSPEYLDMVPTESFVKGTEWTTSKDLVVTPMVSNSTGTKFLVIRHEQVHLSNNTVKYKLRVGSTTVPQDDSELTLRPRDAKMIALDYLVGEYKILYSTAEVFTRQTYANGKTVLILYSDEGDSNEMVIEGSPEIIASQGVTTKRQNGATVISWKTGQNDLIVQIANLTIHLVSRQSAYQMWVIPIPSGRSTNTPYTGEPGYSAIIKGAYLIRNVIVKNASMDITGDIDEMVDSIQILGGAPADIQEFHFNGRSVSMFNQLKSTGVVTVKLNMPQVTIEIPNLSTVKWKSIDSLPEIRNNYDDSKWTKADLQKTYNSKHKQITPTSLFASDYGFHLGYILFRGQFISTGVEKTLKLTTRGGSAFGTSVYLGDKYVGSFVGSGKFENGTSTHDLSGLTANQTYILTVIIDNMGHDENWTVGMEESKAPIGILDYELSGRSKDAITWKIQGNLGGEDYVDHVRGPTNEGGLWAERMGYHLPAPPTDHSDWKDTKGPSESLAPGAIRFYSTSFDINVSRGLDIPISLQVGTSRGPILNGSSQPKYRLQLYVNGWQFGKYVNNIGPQTRFPVPEGIWNYHGKNWVAVSVWNLDDKEIQPDEIKLVRDMKTIWTSMNEVHLVDSPKWAKRDGSF